MKQMYLFPNLASVYAKLSTLQGTDAGQGANLIGVQDAGSKFVGNTVEEVLLELKDAIPATGGGLFLGSRIIDADYQATTSDYTIFVDCTGSLELTLPPITTPGQLLWINGIGSDTFDVTASGTDTIVGAASGTIGATDLIVLQSFPDNDWKLLVG